MPAKGQKLSQAAVLAISKRMRENNPHKKNPNMGAQHSIRMKQKYQDKERLC
jgi:hypothetical protein